MVSVEPEAILQQLRMLRELLAQGEHDLHSIKSPGQEYEEELANLNKQIDQGWKDLDATQDPEEISRLRKNILDYGRDLEKLENGRNEGRQGKEAYYKRRFNACWEKLRKMFVEIAGPFEVYPTKDGHRTSSSSTLHGLPITEQDCSGTSSFRAQRKRRMPKAPVTQRKKRKSQGVENDSADGPLRKRGSMQADQCDLGKEKNSEQHGQTETISSGELYRVFRQNSSTWQAALVLPTENPHAFDVPCSVEDLRLTEDVPRCYNYNPSTKSFKWRRGYSKEGPLYSQRKYPVVFFDNVKFPRKCSSAWIAASDLQLFDVNNSQTLQLVENHGQVRKFVRERREKRRQRLQNVPATTTPEQLENGTAQIEETSEMRHVPAVDQTSQGSDQESGHHAVDRASQGSDQESGHQRVDAANGLVTDPPSNHCPEPVSQLQPTENEVQNIEQAQTEHDLTERATPDAIANNRPAEMPADPEGSRLEPESLGYDSLGYDSLGPDSLEPAPVVHTTPSAVSTEAPLTGDTRDFAQHPIDHDSNYREQQEAPTTYTGVAFVPNPNPSSLHYVLHPIGDVGPSQHDDLPFPPTRSQLAPGPNTAQGMPHIQSTSIHRPVARSAWSSSTPKSSFNSKKRGPKGWARQLPEHLKLKLRQVASTEAAEPDAFKTTQGHYCCPFCKDKTLKKLGYFTNHLIKEHG